MDDYDPDLDEIDYEWHDSDDDSLFGDDFGDADDSANRGVGGQLGTNAGGQGDDEEGLYGDN